MAYKLAQLFPPQFEDANGNPLVLGTIEFYIYNLTTPTPFYTDSTGTSGGTSCSLNSLGQPVSGGGTNLQIFLDTSIVYKVIRKDATGTQIQPTLGPYSVTPVSSDLMDAYSFSGAQALSQHVINSRQIWIDGFTGFDPTGAAVSDAAFVAAINALSSLGGGELMIPQASYIKLSTALVAHYPILLKSGVRGDISSNTNGGGAASSRPYIQWTGAANTYMFTLSPSATGDVIWGGGSEGIEWDCNALAYTAVHLDNTKFAKFDGKVRSPTYAGVVVDSASGTVGNFSQQNIIDLEFIWGVAVACQNADGLRLGGNGSTVPSTQQQLGVISGLVYNGDLIRIAETDNCYAKFVTCAVQAPGTGGALRQVNAGAQPANHNYFGHLVGPVKNDNGIIGPFVNHYNSEGGGFSQLTGSSDYAGDLIDYVTGRVYQSHKFDLRQKISIPPAAFVGDGASGLNKLASQWETLTWPETGGDVDISAIIPDWYSLDAGTISGIEVLFAPVGTSAGNLRFTASLSTVGDNTSGSIVTPDGTVTQTVAAGTQYLMTRSTFTFGAPIAFAKGNTIFINLKRLTADAADTHTGDVAFLGARILYASTGPNSAGSGTYYIPSW